MQKASITLTYKPDDEWLGEILAEAHSNGFSGRSSAWFSKQQLEDLVEALRAFPLPEGPLTLAGGYWKDGVLETTMVSLRLAPTGPRGTLMATVELQGEERSGANLAHAVTLEFQTDYAEVDDFRTELARALAGGSATLRERG